jgi:1-acyl-sn-glycerol-3-phosphate acyltransferase
MSSTVSPRKYAKWVQGWVLPPARLLAKGLFWLFGPVQVVNRQRIPKSGGLLILSNHLSDVDPILVQFGCPRPIHFMGKSELFSMPIVGPMIRLFQAFPIKRGEPDRQAMRYAAELLKIGEVVCIFPEGQLSESGKLQTLKSGVEWIARRANVPVICVGLINSNRILPYGSFRPRRSRQTVYVKWGEATPIDKPLTMDWARDQLIDLTAEITASSQSRTTESSR